jgi:hypothetical protein
MLLRSRICSQNCNCSCLFSPRRLQPTHWRRRTLPRSERNPSIRRRHNPTAAVTSTPTPSPITTANYHCGCRCHCLFVPLFVIPQRSEGICCCGCGCSCYCSCRHPERSEGPRSPPPTPTARTFQPTKPKPIFLHTPVNPQTANPRANPEESSGVPVPLHPLYWIQRIKKAPAPTGAFSRHLKVNSFRKTNLPITHLE